MSIRRAFVFAFAAILSLVVIGPTSAQGPQPNAVTQLPLPLELTVNTPGTAFGILNTGAGASAVGLAGRTDNGYAGVVGYSANRYGVFGISLSDSDAGVFGRNERNGIGVLGRSNSGIGMFGQSERNIGIRALSNTGDAILANSNSGIGVNAASNTADGIDGATGGAGKSGVYGHHEGGEFGYGVTGASNLGVGVLGRSNNDGTGVRGESPSGYGIWGESTHHIGILGSGGGIGVVGRSDNGTGVRGESVGGFGVFGRSVNGPGTEGSSDRFDGVHGSSDAPDHAGVAGINRGGGWGVFGRSSAGTAILGVSEGDGDGVAGSTAIEGRSGVYGYNGHGNGLGVTGRVSGTGWAVYGDNPDSRGTAGYFNGRLHSTRSVTASSMSIQLDHPLDPANKTLAHSFVESPDMLNVYNGNVTTDANGEATVALPAYFEALNRDYRYQLTVIGQFAQAIVANKVRDNHFTIKTDKPNVEVSWQVTGIRQDAYAKAHPIVVEEDKPEAERGSYFHPELFGQPETKNVTWAQKPEMMKQMQMGSTQAPVKSEVRP